MADALGVLDRLTARVTAAVGELDAAGGWALDGAGSLPAWLRDRGRMGGGAASALARTARLAGRGGDLTDGAGRLSPETTAALACHAAIHRVIRTGTGVILDYGRATRTVAAPLYNAVEIRDRGCRFPGCTLPPARCDAHHVQWWTNNGPTSIENLVLLCWHHHHLLHRSNWQLDFDPQTGIVSATGPDGLTRTSRPPGAIALPAPGPAPPAQRAA